MEVLDKVIVYAKLINVSMFSWKKIPKQFFGQCNLYLKHDLNIHTPLKTRANDSYWKETDLLTDGQTFYFTKQWSLLSELYACISI